MEFGLLLHTRELVRNEGAASFDALWEQAEEAEEAGFDHIWLGDSVTILNRARGDCLTTMAALACKTERVKLGAVPFLPALRNPVLLAHTLATVDVISQGRVILAVSVGPTRDYIQRQFEACGVPAGEKAGRLSETIELMRRLWTEESFAYEGRYFRFEEIGVLPKPVQRPGIPIWIAADRNETGFKRVGRLGDGWVTLVSSLEQFAANRGKIDQHAASYGRPGAVPVSALYATLRMDRDGDAAREQGWAWMETFFRQPRARPGVPLHHLRDAGRVRRPASRVRAVRAHRGDRPVRVRRPGGAVPPVVRGAAAAAGLKERFGNVAGQGPGEGVGGRPRKARTAMTVLLRSAEVDDLMDLRTAMTVLEQTYVDQADGQVKAIPPLRLMDRGIRLVAGGLDRADRVGLRVSATGGDALALIYEMSSGKLLSIMNYPFSSLRIAATVGLALDRLAAPEVRSAALIGSGRPGPCPAPGRHGTAAHRARQRLQPQCPAAGSLRHAGVERVSASRPPSTAVSDPREALDRADIVLVSTNSPEPALQGEWLRPGLAVFGCGRPNEFDDDTYLRATLIVVSSKAHELGYYDTELDRPLIRLSEEKRIAWGQRRGAGRAGGPGRTPAGAAGRHCGFPGVPGRVQ